MMKDCIAHPARNSHQRILKSCLEKTLFLHLYIAVGERKLVVCGT